MNTAWAKAGVTALGRLEGARNSLQAQSQGKRNLEDDLRAIYQQVRGDPVALQSWAAASVGPQRAREEGERFLLVMGRKYGDK